MSKPKVIPSDKEEDEKDYPLKAGDRFKANFNTHNTYCGKLIGFTISYGMRYAKVRYDGHRHTTLVVPRYLSRA